MQHTSLFGVYIPPSEDSMSTMNMLAEALRKTDDWKTVVIKYLNVNLHEPRDGRQRAIVDKLGSFNMADIIARFKMRQKQQHWWSWRMWRKEILVSSLCDYILTGGSVMWRRFTAVSTCFDKDH